MKTKPSTKPAIKVVVTVPGYESQEVQLTALAEHYVPIASVLPDHWARVLGETGHDILDLDSESVCGKLILEICKQAQVLRNTMHETESNSMLDLAVQHECLVVLYG